jgi:hypothetical protein
MHRPSQKVGVIPGQQMLVSNFWSSKRPFLITFGFIQQMYQEIVRKQLGFLDSYSPVGLARHWLVLQTQRTKQQQESVNDDVSQHPQ